MIAFDFKKNEKIYCHHLALAEVLWCSSARRQFQIPIGPVCVGNTSVLPASAVRDLWVNIDADVTMRAHVTATV